MSILQLGDNSDIAERSQQPIQRGAMGAYQLRDLLGIARARRQHVCDSESGEYTDRLRNESPVGQLEHRDRRWLRW